MELTEKHQLEDRSDPLNIIQVVAAYTFQLVLIRNSSQVLILKRGRQRCVKRKLLQRVQFTNCVDESII